MALITIYLSGVLRSLRLALGAGAGLATLYTMLYWILRSEDYSLLMGALLLFGVLAILMITTRGVDWSAMGRRRLLRPPVRVVRRRSIRARRGRWPRRVRRACASMRLRASRNTGSRASSGRPESKGGAGAYSIASCTASA